MLYVYFNIFLLPMLYKPVCVVCLLLKIRIKINDVLYFGVVFLCYVCVCVVWHLVSIPCPNYEVVVFQPRAVDIPDLVSVHSPSIF